MKILGKNHLNSRLGRLFDIFWTRHGFPLHKQVQPRRSQKEISLIWRDRENVYLRLFPALERYRLREVLLYSYV